MKKLTNKVLATRLSTLVNGAGEITMNLVFQSTLNANVSFWKGYDKAMVDKLDTKLRVLCAVKWNKEANAYEYDEKKAKKTLVKLNEKLADDAQLIFAKSSFEDLVNAIALMDAPVAPKEKTTAEKIEAIKKRQVKMAEQLRELEELLKLENPEIVKELTKEVPEKLEDAA